MNPLSLKKKLALTFFSLLMVAGITIALSITNLFSMQRATGWNGHTYEVLGANEQMLLSMLNIETGLRGFVASGDEVFLEPLRFGKIQFDKSIGQTRSLTSDNLEQQGRLDKTKENYDRFVAVADSLIQKRVAANADQEKIDALLVDFKAGRDKAAMDAFRKNNADIANAETVLLEARSKDLASTSTATTWTLFLGGLILGLMTITLGVWLTRSLFKQLGGEPAIAAAMVTATSQGDLSVPITLRHGDSTSLLAHLSAMQRSLSQTVTSVRENADGVATASAQIAQGNQDLSGRTEQQASALEETAASMEELSSTVQQNAENARQAKLLAENASEVANMGGALVQQFVSTMTGIHGSSKKMSEIISVIDAIAFQTNILALNAAVEAARAGEQGRGFAVVASEVRNLAQRSAGAAKEIKVLIDSSVSHVEQGTRLVDQVQTNMLDVVNAITRVSDIISEVSAASTEQSQGVAQVGEAVNQMDQVTQQNAALVEESAAAASSLSSQAIQLQQSVAVFKLSQRSEAVSAINFQKLR